MNHISSNVMETKTTPPTPPPKSPTYQRIYSPTNETKLCIIIDSNTPIVTKVPVTPGTLTLGQFKSYASLNETCYKFYFKSHDSEFGTVKEELIDNDSILPVEDGRIVVWVISSDNNNIQSALFGSESPYGRLAANGSLYNGGKSSPAFLATMGGGGGGGFYNDRLNGLESAKLNQEPVYDRMVNSNQHQDPLCIVANLYLNAQDSLGLTVQCPSGDDDYQQQYSNGLLIGRVQPMSVASRDGRVQPGDRVVEINGIDLRGMRASEAVTFFKEVVQNKGVINLVLQKSQKSSLSPPQSPCSRLLFNGNGSCHYQAVNCSVAPTRFHIPPILKTITGSASPINGFDPATELPTPVIEPETTYHRPQQQPGDHHSSPIAHRIFSHQQRNQQQQQQQNLMRGTCSLPRSLTPRSLYTSSNLDNLTSTNDLRYPLDSRSVYEPTTPNSLRHISVALHCGRDSIDLIYATLKADSASLDIKDRQWLKVVVSEAFLGSTLIKWLSRNVYGFCNRSEIKRYANKMLTTGLIQSPMSNATFSEKCYYTLS